MRFSYGAAEERREERGWLEMNAKAVVDGLRFSTYVMTHPFKGFWELRREKRGNVLSATAILFILIIILLFRRQWTGFIFNPNKVENLNLAIQVSSILLPFILWCISNWCITTLMDGEGNFTDIFITSAYALVPLIIFNIPMVILSNAISLNEGMFYTLLDSLSILWTVMLFLFGLMTVHQFTMAKTIATAAIAIAGMIIIVFLFLLFFALVQQMINFIIVLYKELALRYDW